jgi:anti-anti-sigma factor
MSLATADLFPSNSRLSTRLVSELGGARSSLRATIERSGLAVVVCAGGEVDASNDSSWRALLHEAAAMVTPPGAFVVDVDSLEFMGCSAYAALSEEAQRCRRSGVDLRLGSRQPIVARVVAASGSNGLLPVYPSEDAALTTAADVVFG